jgi:UDPglucose--hexose-1-phosphate uridylyltransferase
VTAGPHRRYNPLLDEWVLCSPQRRERPWQGRLEEADSEPVPAYDPACYLCPGNERANGARNPAYRGTFAFDNDFPALMPGGDDLPTTPGSLLSAHAESGACRVLCFSPRHDLSLARLTLPEVRQVVEAWAEEVETLAGRGTFAYVQPFENRGALMGCSNPHPHGQIWATAHVPTLPARKLATQRAYFAAHGRDLLGDYLEEEQRDLSRRVIENDHWVVLVPFWAVWPFETLVLPRRRVSDLRALSAEERDALAEVLKRLGLRYDDLFGCPFPYSMGWQGRPTDGAEHSYWRLHAVYLPPLLRSASVRKFVVGYELTAEAQRDLTPEEAARRLREASERHPPDEPVAG